MDSEDILKRRVAPQEQQEQQASEDSGLTPSGERLEDVTSAQTADDIEQSPEEKQNRAQAGDPPSPEVVEPGGDVRPLPGDDA